MNALNIWSIVLFVVSCTGLWISGINPKWGWWFAIANQFGAWLPYGIVTGQWGMVAMSFVFAVIYGRNLWRWRGTEIATPSKSTKKPDSEMMMTNV